MLVIFFMAAVDPSMPSVPSSRRASFWDPKPAFLRHGLLIFLAQILTLLLVPMLDNGDTLMPIPFAAIALAGAAFTILSLGFRRLAAAIAVTGVVGILYLTSMPSPDQFNRFPIMLVLILAYCLSVCLAIYHAFAANLMSSQRILCGAASFVMVGFVFAAAHGFVHFCKPEAYLLPLGIEGGRPPRWLDFLWLSFSTLTTAGFGDMVPVGAWSCMLSTVEGLCGILFPATLIARIATLNADNRLSNSP